MPIGNVILRGTLQQLPQLGVSRTCLSLNGGGGGAIILQMPSQSSYQKTNKQNKTSNCPAWWQSQKRLQRVHRPFALFTWLGHICRKRFRWKRRCKMIAYLLNHNIAPPKQAGRRIRGQTGSIQEATLVGLDR